MPRHFFPLVTIPLFLAIAMPNLPLQSTDPAALFTEAGVTGTFILYDLQTGDRKGVRPDRWDSAYIPASTFKIFTSLVALETAVIPDDTTTVAWDGVRRAIPEWNRDHTLASAFRVSAVWFYQQLARKIGAQRMQAFLNSVGYGNRTMGGPIDRFWLDGGLKITPARQVDFLRRLYAGDLPFSPRTIALVKSIMIREQTAEYTLRAKTGWSDAPTPGVGWYVGYVERGDDVFFFATELDIRRDADVRQRVDLTVALLRQYGAIGR